MQEERERVKFVPVHLGLKTMKKLSTKQEKNMYQAHSKSDHIKTFNPLDSTEITLVESH